MCTSYQPLRTSLKRQVTILLYFIIVLELLAEQTAVNYYGKRRITPPSGKMLIMHSSRLSENAMNSICENAVYMKVCIIITNSNYKSLRCPNLQEIEPCRPGNGICFVDFSQKKRKMEVTCQSSKTLMTLPRTFKSIILNILNIYLSYGRGES